MLSLLVLVHQSSSLIQITCPSKHIEVFEKEIQPHEMVKSLWERELVL